MSEGIVVPPQDLAAEESVLGTILLSGSALGVASEEGVTPAMFYRFSHGAIFEVMLQLEARGESVDALTVRSRLDSDGKLKAVGGPSAIELLASSVPSIGSFRTYCRIVVSKAKWRNRLRAAYEQTSASVSEDEDAYSRAIATADAADATAGGTAVDAADDFITWTKEDTVGIPTPFDLLTKAIGGGLKAGDVSVFGGWPGHGKTILADMFVLKAHVAKARCHIYFNELSSGIRTARMLSRMTNVPWWNIRDKNLTSEDWKLLFGALKSMPADYDRSEGWGVDEYVRHIRRHRWDLAVIDTASRIPMKDTSEVERVSGALADVARETGCHIILVLQLNLERCKGSERPVPTGRDLLGGGAWFRDARNVIMVHREQESIQGYGTSRVLADGVVVCDKATHGEPEKGFVPVTFNARRMTFDERVVATTGSATAAGIEAQHNADEAVF